MHLDGELILSATDLTGFAACGHLTQLELQAARGHLVRPTRDDPMLDVLTRHGGEHEATHLARFRADGKHTVEIPGNTFTRADLHAAEAQTLAAMQQGADVIYQATFFDGRWRGHADFLLRVDTPSDLGDWSYEVADTKLARRVKAGALLQMCHYSEHVARLQGTDPEHMHVITGDGARHTEKLRHYAAYYRHLKARYEALVAQEAVATETYPDPVEHCSVCRWDDVCTQQRRDDDHLTLVAGLRADQALKLTAAGVTTRTALARTAPGTNPSAVNDVTFEKLRHQAELQVRNGDGPPHLYDVLPPEPPEPTTPPNPTNPTDRDQPWPKRGFAALPAPSPGDLFFDMEGDPFALDDGALEYLWGVTEIDDHGREHYHAFWAHDRDEEKQAFEAFIDFVTARVERHPDLHVYHYAPYEPTRVKHLMGLHGTREQEVDALLRAERFVDLYAVTRQGVRIGTESYSLKQVEHLYLERDTEIAGGADSIVAYEDWLADRDPDRLEAIERYNEVDCQSTLQLRDWLEARRIEAEARFGPIPRPTADAGEPSEELTRREQELLALGQQLTAGVAPDRADRDDDAQARWLLAELLQWHRREEKPEWWAYFHRVGYLAEDDFVDDRECIGGLRLIGEVGPLDHSTVFAYAFDPQDHKFAQGSKPHDPATERPAGEIVCIDDAHGVLHLKRGRNLADVAHPVALIPSTPIPQRAQRDALARIAEWVLAHGLDAPGPYRAALDLLRRRPPRVHGQSGATLAADGEHAKAAARRIVRDLDASYLAIQGPPGSGKTSTGAQMIVDLFDEEKVVGITAHSHAVIGNLLDAVIAQAAKRGVRVDALQKAEEHQRCASEAVGCTNDNAEVAAALADGTVNLVAGTAWLWAREQMQGAVDVLFVDEAGQKSLADVVAVSGAARNLVLLGDPQQLAQPSKGSHPEGAEVSPLEHLLAGAATMPEALGLFLSTSWRMHPAICSFVSEIAYDGKLHAEAGNERQSVDGEAGLRWMPVEHTGNRSSSPEEAEAVAELVAELVGKRSTDREGQVHELTVDDILVVTPYNAQVAKLSAVLPEGARVGTVDKFQGREAPVVIYSLATSTAADVPRNMEFLYDLHRLNVATSRARAMTFIVASPHLLDAQCRTPVQLHLVSALCRSDELGTDALPNWTPSPG